MPRLAIATALALLAGLAITDLAGAARVRGEFGYGYDNNKFREPDAVDPASYVPYRLRFDHELTPLPRLSLELDLEARGQRYAGGLDEGGDELYAAEVTARRRLLGSDERGARFVDLRAGTFFNRRRTVYVSRTAGEEYSVELDDGSEVLLGDRFNRNAAGGEIGLEVEGPARIRWDLDTELGVRNYHEDYEDIPGVDRLDYRYGYAGLRATRYVGRAVRLRLGYRGGWRRYEDRPVRDLAGDSSSAGNRSYHDHRWRGSARVRSGPLRTAVEVTRWERRDRYAGYLDHTEWSVEPELRWRATKQTTVELAYRIGSRDYPSAHVSYNPRRPLRHDDTRRLRLEARYRLPDEGELVTGLEANDVDQESATFTYDRVRAWFAYRFEFRPSES